MTAPDDTTGVQSAPPRHRRPGWLRFLRGIVIVGAIIWSGSLFVDLLEAVKQGNVQLYPRSLDHAYREWRGWYPVRVTISAEVDGRPMQIARDLQCHKTMRLDDLCFGCRVWTQNLSFAGEKLSRGGVVIARYNSICATAEAGYPLSDIPLKYLAWQNDFPHPKLLVLYQVGAPSLTQPPIPSIKTETVKISYGRLNWRQSKLSRRNESLFGYPSPYRLKGIVHDHPRLLRGITALAIEEGEWKKAPWLVEKLRGITQLTVLKFSGEEIRQLRREFFSPITFPASQRTLPRYKVIPMKQTGDNTWTLDTRNYGVEVLYYIGRQFEGNIMGDIPSVDPLVDQFEWYRTAKSVYGDKKSLLSGKKDVLYDPESRRLVQMNKYRSINFYG